MLRTVRLVAGKDLRIEARSRVATNQVLPFAVLVLVLFAFALDPDRGVLRRATPGLFWLAVLFCLLFTVQRSFAVETADGARDALRLAGARPGRHLPRQGGGARRRSSSCSRWCSGWAIVVLYDAPTAAGGLALLVVTALAATSGLAAGRYALRRARGRAPGARTRCSRSSCSRWWRPC